jgi:DNA-binding NarL/FixJ family response regulator
MMTLEKKIRVALVDDDQLARAGLISLLSPYSDISIILEANCGKEIIDKLKFTQVDIILMDIRMKDMNGIDVTKTIRSQNKSVKIIMLSMYEEPSFVLKSIEVDANSYLLKKSKAEEIYQAMNSVMERDEYYRTDFVKDVLSIQMINKSKSDSIEFDFDQSIEFNKRELQILNLLQLEKSSLEISKELCLSKSSVDAYRASMMRKTGTHTTTGLIVYCIKNKLLK